MSHVFTPQIIQTKNFTIEISTTRSFTSQISTTRSFTIQLLGFFVTTSLRAKITTGKVNISTILKQTLNVTAPMTAGRLLMTISDAITQYFSANISTGNLNISTILKQTLTILSAPIAVPGITIVATLGSIINQSVSLSVPGVTIVATPEVRKYTLLSEIDPDTLATLDPQTLTGIDYTLV